MADSTPKFAYPPENSDARRQRRRELARTLASSGLDNVHVLSHESADEALSPRRRDLVYTIAHQDVDSVRDLAAAVGRDHGQVSRDLRRLAEHGLVAFEEGGRSKRPYLPHDHVVIEPVV